MTVTAHPKDHDATTLQQNITALTTKLTVTSSPSAKNAMSIQLDQYQRELVVHYLDIGRLTAANILSTLS